MAVGDIAIFSDTTGSKLPTTSITTMTFGNQVRNDNSNVTDTASVFTLKDTGDYLITVTVNVDQATNGRFNFSGYVLESGTFSGNIFSSLSTGYARDTSEHLASFVIVAFVRTTAADQDIKVNWIKGSDTATGGTVIGESQIHIAQIAAENVGIYSDLSSLNSYGGTTANTVTLDTTDLETDAAVISRSGNTITLATNKKYLAMYSVYGGTGAGRTQRISQLNINSTPDISTRSYGYQRNAANYLCGMQAATLIDTTGGSKTVTVECFRGPGVSADQGGADLDGSWANEWSKLCIIELPHYIRWAKGTGGGQQDLTGTTATVVNIASTALDFNSPTDFTRVSDTEIKCGRGMNLFVWTNIFTARNNISSTQRFTGVASLKAGGTEISGSVTQNYTRGDQGLNDTFGGSFHPAAISSITSGDIITCEVVRISGGETGGTDRTQNGTVGIILLNIDSFIENKRRVFLTS